MPDLGDSSSRPYEGDDRISCGPLCDWRHPHPMGASQTAFNRGRSSAVREPGGASSGSALLVRALAEPAPAVRAGLLHQALDTYLRALDSDTDWLPHNAFAGVAAAWLWDDARWERFSAHHVEVVRASSAVGDWHRAAEAEPYPDARPHRSGGAGRPPGAQRAVEPRDRGSPVPQHSHHRVPPAQGLHQAERDLAHTAHGGAVAVGSGQTDVRSVVPSASAPASRRAQSANEVAGLPSTRCTPSLR